MDSIIEVASIRLADGITHEQMHELIKKQHFMFTTKPEILAPFSCDFYVYAVDLDAETEVQYIGELVALDNISGVYYKASSENWEVPYHLSVLDRQKEMDLYLDPLTFDYEKDFVVRLVLSPCTIKNSNIMCTDIKQEDHSMIVHIDALKRLVGSEEKHALIKKPQRSQSFLMCRELVIV
ncbi:hypothetical protein ACMXYX_17825 (plasmid) [Neptuniibacter sp. QD72_48]|uniref:hypothetical protein n=1 Tax=Neptuniibacter sp. QD72_48 TaxID=3398214 RepID=UPI0039F50E73